MSDGSIFPRFDVDVPMPSGVKLPKHSTMPDEITKPREHIAEAIADHWARLHTSRAGLRTLAEADGCFARRIDAL